MSCWLSLKPFGMMRPSIHLTRQRCPSYIEQEEGTPPSSQYIPWYNRPKKNRVKHERRNDLRLNYLREYCNRPPKKNRVNHKKRKESR